MSDPATVLDDPAAPMPRRAHPWNQSFEWHRPPGGGAELRPEQLEAFDRDGFCVLEGVFDAEEVAAIDAAIEPGASLVRSLLEQLPEGRLSVAGLDTQTVAPNMVGTSEVLRDACTHPRLAAACSDLIGPDVRLYWEQAVYKQPHSAAPVLWHQDNGYTYVEPQAYLTCWIALTDATTDNGCVSVVPGVHRDGTLEHRSTPIGEECWGDWGLAVDVPVRAGDVVVFSSLTPHATRENRTDDVRKAYIVQYMPDGACALEGDPASGAPTGRRLLDDPVLHLPILRDGEPVPAS
jgi:ectoine hydroxylase-related dioxygenase (phytanoyl-CoA dioxygenase family)